MNIEAGAHNRAWGSPRAPSCAAVHDRSDMRYRTATFGRWRDHPSGQTPPAAEPDTLKEVREEGTREEPRQYPPALRSSHAPGVDGRAGSARRAAVGGGR